MKSPGPDGFGSGFFQDAWPIVGPDICSAVQDFFRAGFLPNEGNCTHLVMLPKKDCPTSAADYRPIACCTVYYKIIAKLLFQCLQLVLPLLINENQSAFVSGRCIIHNVLIGQELVRLHRRKFVSPGALMKIDICKAYDSVNWSFLFQLLVALKFPGK